MPLVLLVTTLVMATVTPVLAQSKEEPILFTDPLNHFTVELPLGWEGSAPSAEAVLGMSVITNYSEEDLIEQNVAQEGEFPEGGIKIQGISRSMLGGGLEGWAADIIARVTEPEYGTDFYLSATEPQPITLARYPGLSFELSGPTHPTVLVIGLKVSDERILEVSIMPADSPAFEDAFSIISTIAPIETTEPTTPGVLEYSILEEANTLETLTLDLRPWLTSRLGSVISSVSQFTCPAGTFPGTEATSMPIIHFPFQSGNYWRVGDVGAYFGNIFHCNAYNDYYATDWNRVNSSGTYQVDTGYAILPIANGIVQAANCDPSGYGCHI